jgi:hypothetical protein
LDDNVPRVRQEAYDKLRALGAIAEPVLRQALKREPSATQRRLIQELLEKMPEPTSEQPVRMRRVVRVVELIGNADAVALLNDYASGARGASLTKEAQAALDRIKKRKREQELNPLPRPLDGIPLPLP